jgi:hypothetical protein
MSACLPLCRYMTRTSRQSFLTGQNAEAASVLANLRSANDKFQHIKRADSQTAENEFFEVRAGVRSKHADVSTRQHMLTSAHVSICCSPSKLSQLISSGICAPREQPLCAGTISDASVYDAFFLKQCLQVNTLARSLKAN